MTMFQETLFRKNIFCIIDVLTISITFASFKNQSFKTTLYWFSYVFYDTK